MQQAVTVLDVFSGIGGFSLGLHWAGMRTIAFCEQDEFCRRVLARHWPGIPVYTDIRTLTGKGLHADGVPWPALLCGGFPCQDISQAGRGAGLAGSRSGLWAEMARLVAECGPRWVVVENVPGLRSRGADRVMCELEALGYACWPVVVGAGHAGAPHRRERVWVVAEAVRADCGGARLESWVGGATGPAPGLPAERCSGWAVGSGVCRMDDGVSSGLDRRRRLQALGNAVVPGVAAMIGRAMMAAFEQGSVTAEPLVRGCHFIRRQDPGPTGREAQ